MNTFIIGFIIAFIASTQGAPTWQRRISKKLSCRDRLFQVEEEIMEHGEILSKPNYRPRCEADGVRWQRAQCDHVEGGKCFCVNPETGKMDKNGPISKSGILESLNCEGRMLKNDNGDVACPVRQQEFRRLQKTWDINTDIPLAYYPECKLNGNYMALQRDDTNFFCVDVRNGDKIPDTAQTAGTMPPLYEALCQAYSDVWNQFKSWRKAIPTNGLKPGYSEAKGQKSCKAGLVYKACGCMKICTPGAKATSNECVSCAPSCVCPDNKYFLNGRCISLERCHSEKPTPDVLHADKLNVLTNGLWADYLRQNPNAVVAQYEQGQIDDQLLNQNVAHDFLGEGFVPAPEEVEFNSEESQQYNEEEDDGTYTGGFRGAETIEQMLRNNRNGGGNEEEDKQATTTKMPYVAETYETPAYAEAFGNLYNPEIDSEYAEEYHPGKYPLTDYGIEEPTPTPFIDVVEEETATNYEPEEEFEYYKDVVEEAEENYDGSLDMVNEVEYTPRAVPSTSEEQMIDHQHPDITRAEYPTLPSLTEEEINETTEDFLEEPPCKEELEEELLKENLLPERPSEAQVAQEIFRVLEENKVVGAEESKALMANFENPSIILKKNAVNGERS